MKFRNTPLIHRRTIWPWFVGATAAMIGILPRLPAPYSADNVLLASVGGLWALAFYLHSRHGEDARFAKELMTDFNTRYDKLNNSLQGAIWTGERFSRESKLNFIDYFNLCAEEWLFWQTGYIYEPVWDAWSWGMHQYSKDERVISLWEEERKSKSYYGFEFPPLAPKPQSR